MNIPLLQRLCQTPAIAGQEHRLRDLILAETRGFFDETRIDAMGSLIGVRRPRPVGKSTNQKPLKVMLAAHMDQIGFVVRHIDDKGFLRLQNVGGFDTRNLFARLVSVCPDPRNPALDLPGVMNPGGKPIHIASEADKNKVPDINEFVVDMGLPADQVKKKVKIGDMVVIRADFTQVGKTVVGQCMDNRVACWVAIEALRTLESHGCEIHCVFTVQEEVGCRGAGPASYGISPDIVISLDTTLAVDTPGVPDDQRVSKQGDGVGLLVMDGTMISDNDLVCEFESLAKKKKIKAQRTILPRGGNDGFAIQKTAAGFRVITLVCPCRYIHTITEMILLDDLKTTKDLLAAYLTQVK
ncbi:MAG: M20/M25/M40 family metallo-hydrolase [Planctomycetes bacterium]|nr:M20/M25/M40 family metallo-hydrolase [Planctomycetota bacterium]